MILLSKYSDIVNYNTTAAVSTSHNSTVMYK